MESVEKERSETYRKKEEITETGTRIEKSSGEPAESGIEGMTAGRVESLAKEKRMKGETSRRGRPSNAERLQRSRAGSAGLVLELYGRKRGREVEEEEEGEGKATRKRYNSATAQLSPTKPKEEKGQNEQESMDIEKLKGMIDVKEMLIYLATCMSTENSELRNEVIHLRKGLEKEKEKDRKRMDELHKKIEDKFKIWEKKIKEVKNDRKYEELEKKVNKLTENKGKDSQGEHGNVSESNSTNKRVIDFIEKKEREDRRNNIIIKGLTINDR